MKTIAIVGRTNVGKSTLFNRLAGKKTAIVHDTAGVTRDRKEETGHLYDLAFKLIDTAGLEETTKLAAAMWTQTQKAIHEADVILMVVDGRALRTPLDDKLAKTLRGIQKPVLLVANKCEGNQDITDFYKLGLGDPIPVSAEHNLGMAELYQELLPHIPPEEIIEETEEEFTPLSPTDEGETEKPTEEKPLNLAIVGRPNVGKSSLINKMIGNERLLTGPDAGVTRDAITIPWKWQGKDVLITDTAGLRKRMRVTGDIEKISTFSTTNTIDYTEVAVLVVDATMPMEKQDLTIASQVINEGRALILALNKWDLVKDPKKTMRDIKETMQMSLQQVRGLPICTVSAKTGQGLEPLMRTVFDIYRIWNKRISTWKMNTFLRAMTEAHPPPVAKNGRRIPMKYITQVGTRPPTFVIFSSNPNQLPESYLRYLSNGLRDQFGLDGVPIRIHLRKQRNPFGHMAKKKN